MKGKRQHIIFFDGWSEEELGTDMMNYSFQILYDSIHTTSEHCMCKSVWGKGQARWGRFIVMGCGWGGYFAFTHVYSAIFSNLIGKLIDTEGKTMNGYWKTAWQGATGSFFSGRGTLSIVHPETGKAFDPQYRNILGNWNISMNGENGFKIDSKLKVMETSFRGFCAEIVWEHQTSQTTLGNMYGKMLSFTFLWPDFTRIVTAIGELTDNDTSIVGRVFICGSECSKPECGSFQAKKMVSPPESQ
jgi:hypothetical protein